MAKQNSIGALWVKRSNKGEYLSGYIEVDGQKIPIVCFINGYKKEAKHPDYEIYHPQQSFKASEKADRDYDRDFDARMEEENNQPEKTTEEQNPDDDLYPNVF